MTRTRKRPELPRYNGPPRALLYLRVSSVHQEEGASLETQRQRGLVYCDGRQYVVIGIFTETHTGEDLYQRRELEQIRAQIRDHGAEVLVCYALDRLSRHQAHVAILAEECERHGARLEFVTEEFEDSSTGRFIRSAKAFAAEVEHEKIIERTQRGLRARVDHGHYRPGCKAPYGYHFNEDRTRLEIDPTTAPHVTEWFQQIADGGSLRGITLDLMTRGIPTPTGRTAWYVSTVSAILRNPLYCGEAKAYRTQLVKEHGEKVIRKRPEAEQIPFPADVAPALVTPSLWQLVRARLAENQRQASRHNAHPEQTLLRGGYARCGTCGRALAVARPLSDGIARYRCRNLAGLSAQPCAPKPQIVASTLDTGVWAELAEWLADSGRIWRTLESAQTMPLRSMVEVNHTARLAELEREERSLVERLGRLSERQAKLASERLDLLERERLSLVAEQQRHAGQVQRDASRHARLEDFVTQCTALSELIQAGAMTYEFQRRVLAFLEVEVRVYPASAPVRWQTIIRAARDTMDIANDTVWFDGRYVSAALPAEVL